MIHLMKREPTALRRCHGAVGLGSEAITLMEFADLFSTEDVARKWFERMQWPTGERVCDGS